MWSKNIPQEIFFFKNYAENEAGKLVPERFLFFKKALYQVVCSKWSAAWFHYISIALKLAYNRNKLFKTLHYWPRDTLSFDFSDKGLGIILCDFSTKMFLILSSVNWPNLIAWLPLLLGILGNMFIALFVNQVVTSWVLKLTLAFYMSKTSWQKLEYLENEKSF